MKITVEIGKDPALWDAQLLEFRYAHPFQTTSFADWMALKGDIPLYLRFFGGDQLIGLCLVLKTKNKNAYCLYGPVVKEGFDQVYPEIIDKMFSSLKKNGVLSIESGSTQLNYASSGETKNLPAGFRTEEGESPFVDLRKDIDDIFREFDPAVRKNIRKCKENGMQILFDNQGEYLPAYLDLLEEFRSGRGFALPPFYPNTDSLKIFNRSPLTMELAMAWVNDRFLSGLGYVVFGKVVVPIALAEAEDYRNSKLPANYYLFSEAMTRYQAQGVEIFDITGGRKEPADSKKENIHRFKRQFSKNQAEFLIFPRTVLSPEWYLHRSMSGFANALQKFTRRGTS